MDSYYIDSHAHIYLDQFTDNIDEIINRSLDNKVNKILMPNINLDTVSKCSIYPKNIRVYVIQCLVYILVILKVNSRMR